jgi:hypothetical protein
MLLLLYEGETTLLLLFGSNNAVSLSYRLLSYLPTAF